MSYAKLLVLLTSWFLVGCVAPYSHESVRTKTLMVRGGEVSFGGYDDGELFSGPPWKLRCTVTSKSKGVFKTVRVKIHSINQDDGLKSHIPVSPLVVEVDGYTFGQKSTEPFLEKSMLSDAKIKVGLTIEITYVGGEVVTLEKVIELKYHKKSGIDVFNPLVDIT